MSLGRVLITGGAGVVGSAIADRVVQAGANEVVVFDLGGSGARSLAGLAEPVLGK